MKQSDFSDLRERSAAVMGAHWRQGESHKKWGYTCPNPERYQWQWLWDSCFHAVIWAELSEADRGLLELETLLATMEPSGFLPHMNYVADPEAAKEFWGRAGASSITQPPMFGHAIAELVRRGMDVPEELAEKAAKALRFFSAHRIHEPSGLAILCHPWESGADDSLRWDSFYSVPYGHPRWQGEKIKLLATIQRDSNGTPLSNPLFPVASAWFTASVAFNIAELARTTDAIAASEADGLVEAVENSWDDDLRTWVDAATSENSDASTEGARTRRIDAVTNENPDASTEGAQERRVDAVSNENPDASTEGVQTRRVDAVTSESQISDDPAGDKDSLSSTSSAPTLEALLGILADRNEDRLAKVCEDLFNPEKYGAPYGPAGASQSHKAYDGHGYWRGAAWPQLTYLLSHALQAKGRLKEARTLTAQLQNGAIISDFAEHWHPQTAHPGGATPQSWTALAAMP